MNFFSKKEEISEQPIESTETERTGIIDHWCGERELVNAYSEFSHVGIYHTESYKWDSETEMINKEMCYKHKKFRITHAKFTEVK